MTVLGTGTPDLSACRVTLMVNPSRSSQIFAGIVETYVSVVSTARNSGLDRAAIWSSETLAYLCCTSSFLSQKLPCLGDSSVLWLWRQDFSSAKCALCWFLYWIQNGFLTTYSISFFAWDVWVSFPRAGIVSAALDFSACVYSFFVHTTFSFLNFT